MRVNVNGEERTVEPDATVADLLAQLGLAERAVSGLAVAVDRRVVPRSEYATKALDEGAQVEILRAVGGG
ncbi:MAG: sulfur carrier protein ThiS [Myxococcota bacterium]